ncbi:hypothetical protein LGN19_12360 [Burkholderia sp. AU30198]|uniref:hypothetical protein n=1 Tax=Burkholderia sp. AU30198 TaxID=2879627 RepID=UPI001CF407DC|nr:hypothetical protein [Burkholderia sp. AU30198]MCA8294588.1 hypothetical protein [Burkholderia sp. AU30198]
MKQSEIDRELRLLVKAEAKARRWKSVGTTPYWTNGPLFFSMTLSAGAKEGSFHSWLRFKWLELDHLLWRVLGMSSNENAPFSLHANGAFVLTGWEIQSFTVRDLVWEPGLLEHQLEIATRQAASRAEEVALEADSLDSYIRFLDREHEIFMRKHPRAAVTIWRERLLVHMLQGEKSSAVDVAKERIAKQDSGGFSSGGKTFFERALALNEA